MLYDMFWNEQVFKFSVGIQFFWNMVETTKRKTEAPAYCASKKTM